MATSHRKPWPVASASPPPNPSAQCASGPSVLTCMRLCRRSSLSPSASWCMKYLAVSSLTRPYRRRYVPRSPPPQYSSTRKILPGSCGGATAWHAAGARRCQVGMGRRWGTRATARQGLFATGGVDGTDGACSLACRRPPRAPAPSTAPSHSHTALPTRHHRPPKPKPTAVARPAPAATSTPSQPRQCLSPCLHLYLHRTDLDEVQQAHDVVVVGLLQHRNLRRQALLQLLVQLLRVYLLDRRRRARGHVVGPPDDGEGPRPDGLLQRPLPDAPYRLGLPPVGRRMLLVLRVRHCCGSGDRGPCSPGWLPGPARLTALGVYVGRCSCCWPRAAAVPPSCSDEVCPPSLVVGRQSKGTAWTRKEDGRSQVEACVRALQCNERRKRGMAKVQATHPPFSPVQVAPPRYTAHDRVWFVRDRSRGDCRRRDVTIVAAAAVTVSLAKLYTTKTRDCGSCIVGEEEQRRGPSSAGMPMCAAAGECGARRRRWRRRCC